MKETYKILIIALVLINVYLLFKINNKPVIVDNSQHLLDSIIIENKKQIKADSIRLSNKVDSLSKRIKTINYLRKNERNKYEAEISKFNRPFDSTMYARTNDSIKKVCCPNNSN